MGERAQWCGSQPKGRSTAPLPFRGGGGGGGGQVVAGCGAMGHRTVVVAARVRSAANPVHDPTRPCKWAILRPKQGPKRVPKAVLHKGFEALWGTLTSAFSPGPACGDALWPTPRLRSGALMHRCVTRFIVGVLGSVNGCIDDCHSNV